MYRKVSTEVTHGLQSGILACGICFAQHDAPLHRDKEGLPCNTVRSHLPAHLTSYRLRLNTGNPQRSCSVTVSSAGTDLGWINSVAHTRAESCCVNDKLVLLRLCYGDDGVAGRPSPPRNDRPECSCSSQKSAVMHESRHNAQRSSYP